MIWNELKKPIFILAPMDGVTDSVFRRVIADCAPPDLFYTEFVSVDGLTSQGRQALWKKLEIASEAEKPLIAQVWGMKPENYESMAAELSDMGFAGIDINMGCPAPSEIKLGACSALAQNRPLASEIITATQRGANGIPVSVKCRLGFNEIDVSWPEFLLEHKLDALIVHGRTTKELSKVPNHWDKISEVRQIRDKIAPNTMIIGNGDVLTRAQGKEMVTDHGLDGIMIGRGIFQDPYVFSEASPWQDMTPNQKMGLYKKHITLFLEFWDDTKNPAILKKFAKVYINGFPGASGARARLMECDTADELLNLLEGLQT